MSTIHVPRVDQLDAAVWNEELYSLFSIQIKQALKYFPSSFVVHWGPLIEALFRYGFWELPLRNCHSTFGQSLFGLEYRDAKDLKSIPTFRLKCLSVLRVLPYVWERVIYKLILRSSQNLPDLKNRLENNIETLRIYLMIANFCLFLVEAKYPTLGDRIFGIRPIYPSQKEMRSIEYDMVNRELLWHGFAELLSFVLPLINVYRVKGFVQRLLKPLYSPRKSVSLNWNCAICGLSPTLPHEFGCKHMYCYYCIASHVTADQNYLCTDCKHEANGLSSIRPVSLNFLLKK